MPQLTDLAGYWRAEASRLRQWGACAEAAILERVAEQLECAIRDESGDMLTLEEAARLTGYSVEHLGRLVRQGKLENVGRKHVPRVRPGDLVRKAGHPLQPAPAIVRLDRSKASIARAIATAKE